MQLNFVCLNKKYKIMSL